jgi:hypothetical protein
MASLCSHTLFARAFATFLGQCSLAEIAGS